MRRRAGYVRALGGIAALTWTALALLERDRWSCVGLLALAAGAVLAFLARPIVSRMPAILLAPPRAAFVGTCAACAAGVTVWIQHVTLRDQPLSIDAAVYLLQARAMAHGSFGMVPPHPFQAFGDHFLLEGPDAKLYGIFPPGWPLALVPFVWLGRPMLAGPVVAAFLVMAQAALGKAFAQASADEEAGELGMRASLLVSLPSIARALLTADLLSNAFVASLAAFAVALSVDLARRPERPSLRGLALGVCLGWALSARFLDGLFLVVGAAGILAYRRASWPAMVWGAAAALPFLGLVLIEQHAATGAWLVPTQSVYFQRSDWPPGCHRLGFGHDVGCSVEHRGLVARMGGDGFGPDDALRVVRERSGQLGEDAFGFAPLALLAFLPMLVAASTVDAIAVGVVLALSLVYGLFYYGNTLYFGARFLFPAAPFLWLLVGRATALLPRASWLRVGRHVRGSAIAVVLVATLLGSLGPWRKRSEAAEAWQHPRSDLRRTLKLHAIDRGIIKTDDDASFAAALDPGADEDRRLVVLDDRAGLLDVRRAHPELPMLLSLPRDNVGWIYAARPSPGVSFELDRAWPTFVRPVGLQARPVKNDAAHGATLLGLSHASPGAYVSIPFEVAVAGEYRLRVEGFAVPDGGRYDVTLDGVRMADWQGYSAHSQSMASTPVRQRLGPGRHELVLRCSGRNPASGGYDGAFDALIGDGFDADMEPGGELSK